jgi:hypothetical protein
VPTFFGWKTSHKLTLQIIGRFKKGHSNRAVVNLCAAIDVAAFATLQVFGRFGRGHVTTASPPAVRMVRGSALTASIASARLRSVTADLIARESLFDGFCFSHKGFQG